jgi:hypothetical protein
MKLINLVWISLMGAGMLVGCSSPTPFNIDNDVWVGSAACPENPETSVTVTFSQNGENVQGVLEFSTTARILSGTLKGTTLDIATAKRDPGVVGDFNRDAKTFSGSLQFLNGATPVVCSLTLSYQREAI